MTDDLPFPTSLPEFMRLFPNDAACASYLERLRWREGFVCSCGAAGEPYRFAARPGVLRCRRCKRDTALTAGTIMERTHSPLSTWFWGAYLVSSLTPGMSAVQAWIGGRTRGEGAGVHHKTAVVGIVEVRHRAEKPSKSDDHSKALPRRGGRYAGRLRLSVIPNRKAVTLLGYAREHIIHRSRITTDDWSGYDRLYDLGYLHTQVAERKDPAVAEEWLPLIHLVFSNLKAWLIGVHHGVGPHHLQAYLNEFVFRFNRRFYPFTAFRSLLGIGSGVEAPTYADLYSGECVHPGLPTASAHG